MKKVLITGATGFIGSHVLNELVKQGFQVSGLYRNKKKIPREFENHKSITWVNAQFSDFQSWKQLIGEHDVLINCVGIIRETPRSKFLTLHQEVPVGMFKEAAAKKVNRVIQISALGAGKTLGKGIPYLDTKHEADKVLINSGVDYTIFKPSLVYTVRSEALKLFAKLVSGPITPVIGDGLYKLQPIYVGDLARCVALCLKSTKKETVKKIFEVGGPQVLNFHQILDSLNNVLFEKRQGRKIHKISIPVPVISFFASIADAISLLPILPLTKDQLAMLVNGSVVEDKQYLDIFKFDFTKFEDGLKKDAEY